MDMEKMKILNNCIDIIIENSWFTFGLIYTMYTVAFFQDITSIVVLGIVLGFEVLIGVVDYWFTWEMARIKKRYEEDCRENHNAIFSLNRKMKRERKQDD